MLSQSLACLRGHLEKYRSTGAVFDAAAIVAVISLLDQAVHDARALENMIVPDAGRLDGADLPDNVVSLAARRRGRRTVSDLPKGGAA